MKMYPTYHACNTNSIRKARLLLVLVLVLFTSTRSVAQLLTAGNGLSATGSTVLLGGVLNDALTGIDFGSANSNAAFLFKKGGNDYLYIGNNGNVGIGNSSPQARLHVVGPARFENGTDVSPLIVAYRDDKALFEIRASTNYDEDVYNLFIGKDAGKNAFILSDGIFSAYDNTGVGSNVLSSIEKGIRNTAFGASALQWIDSGTGNTSFGSQALLLLGSGNANTAIGISAMISKASGNRNTAVGAVAGHSNKNGDNNTFIGAYSGFYTGGSSNTFVGISSGAYQGAGNYNVIIGSNDGAAIADSNNYLLLADGQGNERLRVNNNGAYRIGGSYGSTGQVLMSNGNGAAPTWQSPACCTPFTYSDNKDAGSKTVAFAGNILSEKVRVTSFSSGWPDYVFDKGYTLTPLKEVEQFINDKKHLPGVPSAKEVAKNGLDLGDGQAVLLRKIEELTLYMIDINKRLEKLTLENAGLKEQLGKK